MSAVAAAVAAVVLVGTPALIVVTTPSLIVVVMALAALVVVGTPALVVVTIPALVIVATPSLIVVVVALMALAALVIVALVVVALVVRSLIKWNLVLLRPVGLILIALAPRAGGPNRYLSLIAMMWILLTVPRLSLGHPGNAQSCQASSRDNDNLPHTTSSVVALNRLKSGFFVVLK